MRLLRLGGEDDNFELRTIYRQTDVLLTELRKLEGQGDIRLGGVVQTGRADDVIANALRHFAIYHSTAAMLRRGDRLFIGDRSLLFYYQNRLEGYDLGQIHGLSPALAPCHRALWAGR